MGSCLVLSCLVLSCFNARLLCLCRCANETKQGGGGAAEGLKLKLDGSSSRFCDAGRLLASVTALMAAEVVTAEVWGEQVDPEVYEECQVRPLRSADVMAHLPVVPACLPACPPARLPACRLDTATCHLS
jgi:hypothetical protein